MWAWADMQRDLSMLDSLHVLSAKALRSVGIGLQVDFVTMPNPFSICYTFTLCAWLIHPSANHLLNVFSTALCNTDSSLSLFLSKAACCYSLLVFLLPNEKKRSAQAWLADNSHRVSLTDFQQSSSIETTVLQTDLPPSTELHHHKISSCLRAISKVLDTWK